jgi:hypothetical protein
MKNFLSGSHEEVLKMKEKALKLWLALPVKYNLSLRIIDSSGDRIYNSRNLKDCYYIKDAENIAYCQDIWAKTNNCYDYSVWGDGAENIYECMTCGMGIARLKFCFNCWEGASDLEYCVYCIGSTNCFGCVGLYKKKYCIFNKQYTKEDYEILKDKIINHMKEFPYVDKKGRIYGYGEFFPFDLSPTAYNESASCDFFPLKKEEIESKGYTYRELNKRSFTKTILAKDLPDSIDDINDDFTKEIIECSNCLGAFQVIPIELQFYKKIKLPLPRLCHDCRFVERFKFVNPPIFYKRNCMNEGCNNEFKTTYGPKRKEIVYCEKCYQEEVN